jgi:hypothetical protein
MLHKVIPNFEVVVFTSCCFSGHHDSLVRGSVICYKRSFHLFDLLFLFVAASRSNHQDSLVRGLPYVAQSPSGSHMGGRVVFPPVES